MRVEEPADGDFRLTLRARRTIPYGQERAARIAAAIATGTARDLALLDADLGEWLAECVETLLDDAGVAPAAITFVACGTVRYRRTPSASISSGCASRNRRKKRCASNASGRAARITYSA